MAGSSGVSQFFGSIFGGSDRRQQQRQQQQQQQSPNAENLFHSFFGGLATAAAASGLGDDDDDDTVPNHGHNDDDEQQQQQPRTNPPASARVLKQLPRVKLLPEDLVERSNRECVTCLESFAVGETVTRLPCGHFYHPRCVVSWLQLHCTCPVCRYELPTDDVQYERGRAIRMRNRIPRYARHELERLSVAELKQLFRQRHHQTSVVPDRRIIDKGELIDHLVDTGCVELVSSAPVSVKYRISELENMSVKQLKHVMNEEAGVFFYAKDVIEKSDMIKIFCISGRLEILPEIEESAAFDDDDDDDESAANDNRKPAARRSVMVETVDSAGESGDDEEEEATTTTKDSRIHTDLVMEEDPSYTPTFKHPTTHNGSPIKMPSNVENGGSMASVSAAVQPQPVAAAAAASISGSDTSSNETLAPAENASTTAPPAVASTYNELRERFSNLNIAELQQISNEYNVDLSDIMAERDRLDRALAERLAAAAERKPAARSSVQEQSTAHTASQNSSNGDNVIEATGSDVDGDNYREQVSPSQRRSIKRRRGNAASDYDFSSADLHYSNNNASSRAMFLQNRTISELRALAEEQNVDLSGCIERHEIINRIMASEAIGATANGDETAQDRPVLSDSLFENWSVSEIRALAGFVDVDLSSPSASTSRQSMIEAIRADAVNRPHVTRYLHALAPLAALTVPQLRAVAREWQVNVSDCLEKGDLLHRLVTSKTTNQFQ